MKTVFRKVTGKKSDIINRLYETDKNFLKTKVTGNIFTKMSVHCQLLTKRYVCTLYSIAVPGKYKCEGLARFSY